MPAGLAATSGARLACCLCLPCERRLADVLQATQRTAAHIIVEDWKDCVVDAMHDFVQRGKGDS